MSEPNPAADPRLSLTVRMEMFEVYECSDGVHKFLFASSDPAAAREGADRPGDRILRRWWTREGV